MLNDNFVDINKQVGSRQLTVGKKVIADCQLSTVYLYHTGKNVFSAEMRSIHEHN